MLAAPIRRIRYELARRLNRWRPQRDYRWTQAIFGDEQRVKLRDSSGRERTLRLRANTTDFSVFVEVFDCGGYDSRPLARDADITARYEAIRASGKRPLIVDAGANVGIASLFFRDRYPEALIVAIEPEASNFAELQRRLGGDPLVRPVRAALAPADGHVQVVDPAWGNFGFRTTNSEPSPTSVPAYSVSSVVAMTLAEPFLLKVDIEGFEKNLFADPAVIDRFYATFIELHDWLLPKQRTSASFLQAVSSLDRDFILLRNSVLTVSNAPPG